MSPRSDPRTARAEASSAPTSAGAGDRPSPPDDEGAAPAGAAEAPALSREEIDRLLLARADRAIYGQPGEPAAALPTTLYTPPPPPPPRPPRRGPTAAGVGDRGEDAAGPLEVTIGRLEVVAPPPPPEPRPRHRPTPHTSLDDYLQGRRVGG